MTVYLVRHGETALNAARIVQPADTPLSERGRTQAERLARRLAAAPIAAIRSSDLPRALETAAAIAHATGARVELDPSLQERNFGRIRGTPYAELDQDIFAPDYVPPEGESWAAFHGRVERAWAGVEAAVAGASGDLVVVTHGLVCRAMVEGIVGPAAASTVPERFGNTAVTILDGPPWRPRVVACTAHLGAGDDRAAGPA